MAHMEIEEPEVNQKRRKIGSWVMRKSRGQAIIEFAILLPLLLIVLLGITEFGRVFMTANLLTQAAREGVRIAAVGGDSTAVATRVNEVLSGANITILPSGIQLAGPNPADASKKVTVTVESTFQFLGGTILPFATLPLTGTAVMRFEG